MSSSTKDSNLCFDTQHEDIIHDAQLDYYGKRLATCSSDRTIRLFEIDANGSQRFVQALKGHEGPVWQVSWAHPKFGSILASGGYDGRVVIWKEESGGASQVGGGGGNWTKIKEHTLSSSVNSVAWAPHELGAVLACGSSDGQCTILSFRDDGSWEVNVLDAHAMGCNAVSWASATPPGSLTLPSLSAAASASATSVRRLATAGCDNLVKIWSEDGHRGGWNLEAQLEGHSDWVRDVAFAPNIGLERTLLASCGQDRQVYIWSQVVSLEPPTSTGSALNLGKIWKKQPLKEGGFPEVVWRVSWSLSGNVLAVSCGDQQVSLWKENLKGEWECISGDLLLSETSQ